MRANRDAKRFLHREALFITLSAVLALSGCGAGQSRGSGASPGDEASRAAVRIQIPEDPTLLLPAECFGAAYLDVELLRRNKLLDAHRHFIDRELNSAQKKLADYLFEHSTTAVFCMAKVGDGAREEPDAVAIIRGSFSPEQIVSITTELTAKGKGLVSQPATKDGGKIPDGYTPILTSAQGVSLLLDDRTVLAASWSLVPKVLAAAAGGESVRFVGSPLYRKLNPNVGFGQYAFSGALALPSNVKEKVTRKSSSNPFFKKYVDVINGITSVGLRIDLKSAVDASLVLETSSPDHPAWLVDAIKGMILLGKFIYQDADFLAVANRAKVSADGLLVRLQTHATAEQVVRLVSLFSASAR